MLTLSFRADAAEMEVIGEGLCLDENAARVLSTQCGEILFTAYSVPLYTQVYWYTLSGY
jgi:hypothetical protein